MTKTIPFKEVRIDQQFVLDAVLHKKISNDYNTSNAIRVFDEITVKIAPNTLVTVYS